MNKHEQEFMFFNLIEGNLSKNEEQEALSQIEANPELKREWELWQMTIIGPINEENARLAPLLLGGIEKNKRQAFHIAPFNIVAAASVLLAIGISILYNYKIDKTLPIVVNEMQDNSIQIDSNRGENKNSNSHRIERKNPLAGVKSSIEKQTFKNGSHSQNENEIVLELVDTLKSGLSTKDSITIMPYKEELVQENLDLDTAIMVEEKPKEALLVSYAAVTKISKIKRMKNWLTRKREDFKNAVKKPQFALNTKDKKIIISNNKYALTLKR